MNIEKAGRACSIGGQLMPEGIGEHLKKILHALSDRHGGVKPSTEAVARQVAELREDHPELFTIELSDEDVTLLLLMVISTIGGGVLFPVRRPS